MPFSSGTYTGLSNSFNDAVAETVIDPLDWNALFTDIETALNDASIFLNTSGKKIIATPTGAASSGTPTGAELMTVLRINTPARQGGNEASRTETTSPFELYLGGSYFTDTVTSWDPTLYYGYNASRADSTQPAMRFVIEGGYVHASREDFEIYWEYLSKTGGTIQRPIFFYHEKDGTASGLEFTEYNLTFNSQNSNNILFQCNSGSAAPTALLELGSVGMSMWAGPNYGAGNHSGVYALTDPTSDSRYNGALLLYADVSSSASTLNDAYGIHFYTGSSGGTQVQRFGIYPDGAMAFYHTGTDFTNYERLDFAWDGSGVLLQLAAGGTGNAAQSIRTRSNTVILNIGAAVGGSAGFTFGSDGANWWSITSSGHLIGATDNTYDIGASGATRPRTAYIGTSIVLGTSTNITTLASTGANVLGIGGTSSSFPALKRSSATLQARLADDSAYASFSASRLVTPLTSGLTIASGAITVTGGYHTVDTESAAASDDLDTINGGTDGAILVLRAVNSAHTVVVKDGTGNIQCAGDMSLDNAQDTITLIFDNALSTWLELHRSDNGA